MESIFLDILNRSIAAGWLILIVIALRLLLRRAPRWIHCLLWAFVAFRLVCPFSMESIFSLIPSRETIRRDVSVSSPGPVFDSGVRFVDNAVNNAVNRMVQESAPLQPETNVNPLRSWLFAAGIIWIAGMTVLLLYALVTYVGLWMKIRTAVRLEEPVMVSEFVDTPFVFGVIRPRVYLPSHMEEELRGPVTAHELAHLRRRDHLWKILGYALLAVYWFHPLCWAAYILLCRDIELACDEKVIRGYDMRQKKQYSEALLACSMDRHAALVCPLAFGEVGVKARIKSVLHYRKPAIWAIAAAVAVCAVAAVCFLTDPVREGDGSGGTMQAGANGENEADGVSALGGAGGGERGAGSGEERGGGAEGVNGTGIDGTGGDGGKTEENPADGSGQDTEEAAARAALREQLVREWAEAFVGRDGNAIEAMASRSLAGEMVSGPEGQREFGVSSPWPRETDRDICVLGIGEESAQVLYYAWTSHPHVSVWKEDISYEFRDGKYIVTAEALTYLDNISTREEFCEAYDYVPINGSAMDYESNGAGEDLNVNALQSFSGQMNHSLFQPESAAVELLNLSGDTSKIRLERVYEERGSVNLYIHFPEEEYDLPVPLTMVQPYGPEGIWIPKDYTVDVVSRFLQKDWDEIRGRNLSLPDGPGAWEDVICIAEIPEEKIKLYGYNDREWSGQGVAIEIGDDVNYFDWVYTSTRSLLPECYWNRTDRQLQVALNIYTGTGVAAQELHVLQYHDTATLTDNVLELNDYGDMLQERIHFRFEEETGRLTLFDADSGKDLASVTVEDSVVEGLELGCISRFLLGEQIVLQVDPGCFVEGGAIAMYPEDMPQLEADLVPGYEGSGEEITFSLGEIRVSDSAGGRQ